VSTIYRNKNALKQGLMVQLQAYRNIAIKSALLPWTLAFMAHFSYKVMVTDAVQIQIDEQMYESFLFSIGFGVIGYCLGGIISANFQRRRMRQLNADRLRRKKKLEEQVAVREAKLQMLNRGAR
jgi:predicted MFS family arabinose efflux permease